MYVVRCLCSGRVQCVLHLNLVNSTASIVIVRFLNLHLGPEKDREVLRFLNFCILDHFLIIARINNIKRVILENLLTKRRINKRNRRLLILLRILS